MSFNLETLFQINVGDKLPDFEFITIGQDGAPTKITSKEVFDNKKVVLFSVPGAFTPTCNNAHCPAYVQLAQRFKQLGVATVACTAVNDAYVLKAWSDSLNATGKILFLSDGNGDFVKKIGLSQDLRQFSLGTRGKRFALVAENGVVTYLAVDAKGLAKSSAESVEQYLTSLQSSI